MNTTEVISQKLRNEIRPIFEMLLHKKFEMSTVEWESFVERTEQNIIRSANQYVSDLLEKDKVFTIHHLFNEFLSENLVKEIKS